MEVTDWVAVYAAGLSTFLAYLTWRRTRTRVKVTLEYDDHVSVFGVRVLNLSEHRVFVKEMAVDLLGTVGTWVRVKDEEPVEPHDSRYFGGPEWATSDRITVQALVRLGNDKVVRSNVMTVG